MTDEQGLRAIEDELLQHANLVLTKERGQRILAVARAALAATPAASDGSLDVDRLARAIDAAWRREDRNPHAFGESLADEGRVLAREIAKEWPDA